MYTDINGIVRTRENEGAVGDLWVGSSTGPTLDGRLGVDVAVPGELGVGAYSPDTYYSQFPFNILEGSNGLYGIQTAVSAAAPVLAGVIALMLEVNPNLDYQDVRDLLHQSARSDAYTGATPNSRWGYGKLDALVAIEATIATVTGPPLESVPTLYAYPNPASRQLQYRWEGALPVTLSLHDVQGRQVMTRRVTEADGELNLGDLTAGLYLLKCHTGNRTQSIKVRVQ